MLVSIEPIGHDLLGISGEAEVRANACEGIGLVESSGCSVPADDVLWICTRHGDCWKCVLWLAISPSNERTMDAGSLSNAGPPTGIDGSIAGKTMHQGPGFVLERRDQARQKGDSERLYVVMGFGLERMADRRTVGRMVKQSRESCRLSGECKAD
jgi:hypothetical protein